MKNKIYVLVFMIFIISCRENPYEKLDNGVVIRLDNKTGAEAVRLQVVNDKTIRVTAAPSSEFSKDTSLVVINRDPGEWTVSEEAEKVILKTSELVAEVVTETGEVCFKDLDGKVLLREKARGGKTFTPVTFEGEAHHSIRQVFESPEDEAFYGLGQHQNRQMNYKGEDVELAQHNIVAVVPFLYSSKNYGILWDNYSITRFGDPRAYEQIAGLKLFDKSGSPGGLTAQYYSGDTLVEEKAVTEIDHQYLEHKPTPVNYRMPNGRVVYEGFFSSDADGVHKFLLYASGYFKLWVDDELIFDKWRQGWNPWYNKFTVAIRDGEMHKIKLEWDLAGAPYLALKHLDPMAPREQQELSLFSEVGDEIDYYFIKGEDADDVIGGYRQITGKAPIMPKWAMGYWQSRERYRNQEELINVVKEYRRRKIPLDNIVLDWQYWEDPKWGSHEFDVTRFPDPEGMVEEIHDDLNARIMISVWPKYNKGTDNFHAMHDKGYLFRRNLEKGRKDWVGPGYVSTFYDPFNPGARDLFWDQLNERLFSKGIDAWWLDATEPDMHSNLSVEERKLNMHPTAMGCGAKYFNAYSLMNAKGVYEGQRQTNPDQRVFILTRSAFAGQQRYASATWSGDVVSRWSDLADQISAGLNLSISGIPYWTMDIGGFSVERRYENPNAEDLKEWRELNARWFQYGTFCPVFRSHGQFPYREIYNIAPEGHIAYETMVWYTRLRYRLMPYIYSLAGKTFHNDYTIMRPLIMDFPNDMDVREITDQYMFGPGLLVNPVYEYQARSRKVYLPDGAGWYDFYTGKYEEEGKTMEAEAPLNKMPLYVKAGSIIPFGPDIQYTDEKFADPLTLYVYAGADGQFVLYEDENINYNYEKGAYSEIPLAYNDADKTLTIGERKGSFDGMPGQRTFQIIYVSKDAQVGVDFNRSADKRVTYLGNAIEIGLE